MYIPWLRNENRLTSSSYKVTYVLVAVVNQKGIWGGTEMLLGTDQILSVHPVGKVVMNPFELAGETRRLDSWAREDTDVLSADKVSTPLDEPITHF